MAQQKEIISLQQALTAAGHQAQREKATRQDLERELFHTKTLLKTAYVELNEGDTRTKALEGHLHAARAEVQTLTQQFCNINEELDMVQRKLKQSYRLRMDSSKRHPAARHTASSSNPLTPVHRNEGGSQSLLFDISQVSFLKTSAAAEGKGFIQASPETAHGVTLKDLNRMARNIPAFTPELAGEHDVHAYLREIDFYLQSWTSVNHQDRLYLLWITCSPEVRCFLARQTGHIQSDYQQLKQTIIKEFSDLNSHGLVAALAKARTGPSLKTPQAYYHRLR